MNRMRDDIASGAPVPGDTSTDELLADSLHYLRYLADQHPAASPQAPDRDMARVLLAEYDRLRAAQVAAADQRSEARAKVARLSAALDAVDGLVLDGGQAIALGLIARAVGLSVEASGALLALTVADRIEELDRLRGQRDAALALHRNDTSGAAAPASPGMREVCMHEWPCPTARALGVEEDTRG